MSEDRLISAKSLIIGFRHIAMEHATEASNSEHILGRVLHEHDYKIYNMIADHLESKGLGRTVDAVPREEHELLVRRLEHLLESDYIRSFDEVKLGTGEYKRDIREADLENQRAHWIANCTCSRCMRGIRGYAIQSGYVFCPFCGADMREVTER